MTLKDAIEGFMADLRQHAKRHGTHRFDAKVDKLAAAVKAELSDDMPMPPPTARILNLTASASCRGRRTGRV